MQHSVASQSRSGAAVHRINFLLTRSAAAQVSHGSQAFCGPALVPSRHSLPQDPTFCSILWPHLGTASQRIRRFAAFCVVPSRYRLGTLFHRINFLLTRSVAAQVSHVSQPFCGPASVQPWYRVGTPSRRIPCFAAFCGLTSVTPPTGAHVLQYSVVTPRYRLPIAHRINFFLTRSVAAQASQVS